MKDVWMFLLIHTEDSVVMRAVIRNADIVILIRTFSVQVSVLDLTRSVTTWLDLHQELPVCLTRGKSAKMKKVDGEEAGVPLETTGEQNVCRVSVLDLTRSVTTWLDLHRELPVCLTRGKSAKMKKVDGEEAGVPLEITGERIVCLAQIRGLWINQKLTSLEVTNQQSCQQIRGLWINQKLSSLEVTNQQSCQQVNRASALNLSPHQKDLRDLLVPL